MSLTLPIVVGVVFGLGVYALIRALMPTRRSAVAPEIPTFVEQGLPDLLVSPTNS